MDDLYQVPSICVQMSDKLFFLVEYIQEFRTVVDRAGGGGGLLSILADC